MALTPAVFLDKDGTLLQDVPHNVDPARMVFASGVPEGLILLASLGLPIIVISNQPGVALGRFDLADLQVMQRHLVRMVAQAGAVLADGYYCPHYPDGTRNEFACPCECRKPQPGLLLAAAQDHGVDLQRSWFVGDILNDVEAGRRAGCHTILIDNGNETLWHFDHWRIPHCCVTDFLAACRYIAARFEADQRGRQ